MSGARGGAAEGAPGGRVSAKGEETASAKGEDIGVEKNELSDDFKRLDQLVKDLFRELALQSTPTNKSSPTWLT